MGKKEMKGILILILVSIAIIGVLLILSNYNKKTNFDVSKNINNEAEEFVQILRDGSKLNISDNLKKIKKLNGLEISNISLKEKRGITILLADVENKTNSKISETIVRIEVLDKQENVITELTGVIEPIQEGKRTKLNVAVSVDVANAYDLRISKK